MVTINLGQLQEELIETRRKLADLESRRARVLALVMAQARTRAASRGLSVTAAYGAYKYVYKCLEIIPDIALDDIDEARTEELVNYALDGYKSRHGRTR